MQVSSTINPLISSLIVHGNTLATLLREAKSQPNKENPASKKERLKLVHENVGMVVHRVLEKLKSPQLAASFSAKIISRVLDKIQVTLQNFIKFDKDNASKYEYLVQAINDFKSKTRSPAVNFSSVLDDTNLSEAPPAYPYLEDQQEDQFAVTYENLTGREKKCLFCISLFSAGMEIKKREIIYWWVAMGLIDDPLEGDDVLAILLAEEFIERTIRNKKLCSRYKMNADIWSKIQATSNFMRVPGHGSWVIMEQEQQQQLQRQPSLAQRISSLSGSRKNVFLETLVLNISQNSLNVNTFKWLYRMKNVKVLHLGSWHHNPKRNIMVEDIESLKGLRQMSHITFLSLQGISGIVELPDSVYKLENLKVLDLKACPNLEFFSEGIEALKQLKHLDLSECYLLAHIPHGIASLTELKTLKGFVINPEDYQVRNGNQNRGGKNVYLCASFSDLSNLRGLIKLSIRTRRMNFPTSQDFGTLCGMKRLTNLRIAWVLSYVDVPSTSDSGRLPSSLRKLEVQAAPEKTMLRLLRIVSEDTQMTLEKLYIRGGRLWDLKTEGHNVGHVHTVRLRYLPELRIHWDEFRKLFPRLTRVEVSGCPNLISFPCDENGVWEEP